MESPGRRVFAAIGEAMAELRAGRTGTRTEQRREAHMRQVLRATLKETDGSVAVVCGAWHVPALTAPLPAASKDAALLRGIPKRKAALAWVPWTHSRLAAESGYGAGITSPGWYHHLFAVPDQTIARWLTRVAAVLRGHDIPVSSAHIIEAVRLAETLAIMRGRPLAGLAEVSEADQVGHVRRGRSGGRVRHPRPGGRRSARPGSRPRAAGAARRRPARPGEGTQAEDRAPRADARARPAQGHGPGPFGVPAPARHPRDQLGETPPPTRSPAPAPSTRPGRCAGGPNWR